MAFYRLAKWKILCVFGFIGLEEVRKSETGLCIKTKCTTRSNRCAWKCFGMAENPGRRYVKLKSILMLPKGEMLHSSLANCWCQYSIYLICNKLYPTTNDSLEWLINTLGKHLRLVNSLVRLFCFVIAHSHVHWVWILEGNTKIINLNKVTSV